MRHAISGWLAVVVLGLAGRAAAEARPYRGPHPLDLDGHWHDEPDIHVHDALPVGLGPFADADGALVFLGDPVAYGYRGAVYRFDGVHPLPAAIGSDCGITGEHRHWFAPEGEGFEQVRGVYRYTGPLRGGVRTLRPRQLEPSDRERPRTPEPAPEYVEQPAWYSPYVLPGCATITEVMPDGTLRTTSFGSPWGCGGVARVVPRARRPEPAPVEPRAEPPPARHRAPARRRAPPRLRSR